MLIRCLKTGRWWIPINACYLILYHQPDDIKSCHTWLVTIVLSFHLYPITPNRRHLLTNKTWLSNINPLWIRESLISLQTPLFFLFVPSLTCPSLPILLCSAPLPPPPPPSPFLGIFFLSLPSLSYPPIPQKMGGGTVVIKWKESNELQQVLKDGWSTI